MKKLTILFFLAFTFTNMLFGMCDSIYITQNPVGYVCQGDPVTYTVNTVVVPTSPSYIWIVNGDTIPNDTTDIVVTSSGTISVTMSSTGCSDTSASIVRQDIEDVTNVTLTQDPTGYVCKNEPILYTADTVGPVTTASYLWTVGGDTVSNSSNTFTSTSGDVVVYMTPDGCSNSSAASLIRLDKEYVADYAPITQECNQPTGDLQINSIFPASAGPDSSPYTWELYVNNESLGTESLYDDVPMGNHILHIEDINNCIDTFDIVMSNSRFCATPIPSEVITPNGDGNNDTWTITYINDYPENEVFIFDRWGQRVYYKEGYDNSDGWDVTYIGLDMPVSTYYYVLKIKLLYSDDIVMKGAISVFR